MILTYLGHGLIILGLLFILISVLGIYRFDHFYPRILVASKIDTVGNITLMVGVILLRGFSWFSLKVFFVLLLMTLINPLVTHTLARSAYRSGVHVEKESP